MKRHESDAEENVTKWSHQWQNQNLRWTKKSDFLLVIFVLHLHVMLFVPAYLSVALLRLNHYAFVMYICVYVSGYLWSACNESESSATSGHLADPMSSDFSWPVGFVSRKPYVEEWYTCVFLLEDLCARKQDQPTSSLYGSMEPSSPHGPLNATVTMETWHRALCRTNYCSFSIKRCFLSSIGIQALSLACSLKHARIL